MNSHEEAVKIIQGVWPYLHPHHTAVVIVGGIAAHLYELHPDFKAPQEIETLETIDLDVGLPLPLAIGPHRGLLESFISHGMSPTEEQDGLRTLTRIYLPQTSGRNTSSPYIEFLAQDDEAGHLIGPHAGIKPRLSKSAWMLYWETYNLKLPGGLGTVRVPHPLAYGLQKVLIADEGRPSVKYGKDLSDALFVLAGFLDSLPTLAGDLTRLADAHPLGTAQVARAVAMWREAFQPSVGKPTGPNLIARRPRPRHSSDLVRQAATLYAQEILVQFERWIRPA